MAGLKPFKQAAEDASFFLRRDGEGSGTYARRIFHRVFTADIERVIRMEVRWRPQVLVASGMASGGVQSNMHAAAGCCLCLATSSSWC